MARTNDAKGVYTSAAHTHLPSTTQSRRTQSTPWLLLLYSRISGSMKPEHSGAKATGGRGAELAQSDAPDVVPCDCTEICASDLSESPFRAAVCPLPEGAENSTAAGIPPCNPAAMGRASPPPPAFDGILIGSPAASGVSTVPPSALDRLTVLPSGLLPGLAGTTLSNR